MKWLWLQFRQLYFLARVNCYLIMAVSLQWPVRCENARLHFESACNQKRELILDGVV